jgi:hypothetical protein
MEAKAVSITYGRGTYPTGAWINAYTSTAGEMMEDEFIMGDTVAVTEGSGVPVDVKVIVGVEPFCR